MIYKTIKVIKKGEGKPVKIFVKEDVLQRIVERIVKIDTGKIPTQPKPSPALQ